jgi:hypothetical protein
LWDERLFLNNKQENILVKPNRLKMAAMDYVNTSANKFLEKQGGF